MLEKACCPAAAAGRINQLNIDGNLTGIVQLDAIIEEVLKLGLNTEGDINRELLNKVKNYNYVPSSKEDHYRAALFIEYSKKVG